ncbi:MAG TPA: glycosyltransferase [Solirubrobacteraceae bacterium]|nr:glycosyltransferase [Solirubrobacteraceae bacterium]
MTMGSSIALAMIVRDEAEVIGRCLQSVREHIDYWVICDTGSTDGTQEIVGEALADVPGELHERPWVSFGHNRTELLGIARGKADYLLLLDADMTVSIGRALAELDRDAYMLRFDEDPEYWLKCLVSGRRRWWYEGSTHEYIATDEPHTTSSLKQIVVHHHHDGSARAQKFLRDKDLLVRDLRCEPDNPRVVFYLAQTCRDLGEHRRAMDLYSRRARMGGWEEEAFYALYQVGVMQAQLGEWTQAMAALIVAWERRSIRIEPLYALASGLRMRGDYHTAHLFAKRGLGAPKPSDHLFVERWIYEWGLLFEYSIAAYWVGDPHAALRACDRLLDCKLLPDAYRRQTVENRAFCLQALAPDATSDSVLEIGDGRRARLRIAPQA